MSKRSKAAERPAGIPPPDDPAWDIKIALANMGEKDDFLTVLREAAETGITADLYPWYARYVKAWPYAPLDPTKPEDYRGLTFDQWKELDLRMGKALGSFRA